MSARYDEEWVNKLLDAERRFGSLRAEEFLADVGLQKAESVVDYGCGPGFLSLPAAEIVGPAGRVYALDIEPKMVSLVAQRAAEAGADNITAVLNQGREAPLPDALADLALCCLVFHYSEEREGRIRLARDLERLVKAGGRAVVVQWSHQVPYEETNELLTEAGFDCDDPPATGDDQYRVIATKQQRPSPATST